MSQTISDEYLKEQQKLHENPNYGIASTQFASSVANLIRQSKAKSLTDYGAGKQRLWSSLEKLGVTDRLQYQPYDPAFPEYGPPKAADLVCCIDVLEHIEPELLNNVLQELSTLVTRAGFFTIHQGPAGKNAVRRSKCPLDSEADILVAAKVESILRDQSTSAP